MASNLVIVESPAKAKTIEKFLGRDYKVMSSYGHVRDLAKNDKAVDIDNKFEPVYLIPEEKEKVIKDLKKEAGKAQVIWLATDEDREGEAISWHLFDSLGLKKSKTRRIVFHEITKTAIREAIENPRQIDMRLVEAQQARRILDRLVGFELSPVLWKKIKPQLSAGRVQSVAVRLIVERERAVMAHEPHSSYRVVGSFLVQDESGNPRFIRAELPERLKTLEEAESLLRKLAGSAFKVSNLETKPGKRTPSPPFTTSTLQQEASRKLGFSVSQTMMVAQKLYENGHITYMRTDSVNLSKFALKAAQDEIHKNFGEAYAKTRQYKTKSASAQEAHEAIRPTYFEKQLVKGDNREQKLYDLIWKRAIASQMSDARLEKTIVTIQPEKVETAFIATGEVIKFDGFLKVYLESTDDEDTDKEAEGLLPPLAVDQSLELDIIEARERFTYPPPRFTEASLVKKLEELGIGRPSTYAPTISTIQKRGYVVKEEREGHEREYRLITLKEGKVVSDVKTEITGAERNKLFPTDIGMVVTDFLVQNFSDILDYNFTATVEKEFDDIAEGNMQWRSMLADFYKPFHKKIVITEETSERASGERILGKDPKSDKTVSVRIGRYGPMAQKKQDDSDEKPTYAKLRPGQRLETITLEEALDLFKLPRDMGALEEQELVVSIGRYGPYIRHGEVFYSLPKEEDPYEITVQRVTEIVTEARKTPDLMRNPRKLGAFEEEEVIVSRGRFGPYVKHKGAFYSIPKSEDPFEIGYDKAVELIQTKRDAANAKVIKRFDERKDLQVLKGKFGPYIKLGRKNIKIPSETDPAKLTFEQAMELAGRKPVKKAAKKAVKKKAAKKAAKKKVAKKAAKKPAAKTKTAVKPATKKTGK